MFRDFSFSFFTRCSYTQSHDRTLGLRVTGGLDTNAVRVDAVNGDSKIFRIFPIHFEDLSESES